MTKYKYKYKYNATLKAWFIRLVFLIFGVAVTSAFYSSYNYYNFPYRISEPYSKVRLDNPHFGVEEKSFIVDVSFIKEACSFLSLEIYHSVRGETSELDWQANENEGNRPTGPQEFRLYVISDEEDTFLLKKGTLTAVTDHLCYDERIRNFVVKSTTFFGISLDDYSKEVGPFYLPE